MSASTAVQSAPRPRDSLDAVVIRFAGDSGDGMQLTGTQFTQSTALMGNDLATFPDFPAEIRAPAGTTYGVSAFQINFGSHEIKTAGDAPDVLVAMNPAALKVNLTDLVAGGLVVVNTGAFTESNLKKAGYAVNPLEDETLTPYRVLRIDISRMTLLAVDGMGLSNKEALRCKNFWTLGLMLWMYGRDREGAVSWIEAKFAKRKEIAAANVAALNAGHAYGETAELPSEISAYVVPRADVKPGLYRAVTGTEALAWGLLAGSRLADLKLFLGSYPITPASPLLHVLAGLKNFGVVTFQAEDEIAAACSAIGASYAGALGITSSSGPGIALKGEAIGLAVGVELPLIIVNSQRAGPTTGMPTKTEQSDLYQAMFGRNGDCPMPVIASATSGDCFDVGIEAVRLATRYMTPVMVLTDGYLANAAEPWAIPDMASYKPFPTKFRTDPEGYQPYARDASTLARAWVQLGTPGLEHRLGGLERDHLSGNISYDPANHQRMTNLRADKIAGIAKDIPAQALAVGDKGAKLGVVGWGSTFGPINQAVKRARALGLNVAQVHLRYINPFPANLGEILSSFDRVLVPEMNTGQLLTLLRSTYLVPAEGLNKVSGQPFKVAEILAAIRARMEN